MSAFLTDLNQSKAQKYEPYIKVPENASEFKRVNLSPERTKKLELLKPAETAGGFDMTDCLLSSRAELKQLDKYELRSVEQLLCSVSPPNFQLPIEEKPTAALGIISSKPIHKRGANGSEYAHFALTDLKYEIDVYAFGKKLDDILILKPGTVIAISSPHLTISKSSRARLPVSMGIVRAHRSILLLGTSKYFGRCRFVQTQSKRCPNWVDTRHHKYCNYHLEKRVFVASGHRPEFNSTVTRMYEPRANGSIYANIKGGSVKWLNGLQRDIQKMEAEQSPVSANSYGVHHSYEDEIIMPRAERERLHKRRQEHLNNERRIRAKLASRTNGYMLKEYDYLGKLVDPESPKEPEKPRKSQKHNDADADTKKVKDADIKDTKSSQKDGDEDDDEDDGLIIV